MRKAASTKNYGYLQVVFSTLKWNITSSPNCWPLIETLFSFVKRSLSTVTSTVYRRYINSVAEWLECRLLVRTSLVRIPRGLLLTYLDIFISGPKIAHFWLSDTCTVYLSWYFSVLIILLHIWVTFFHVCYYILNNTILYIVLLCSYRLCERLFCSIA